MDKPDLGAGSIPEAGGDRPLSSPLPQAALDRARHFRKARMVRELGRDVSHRSAVEQTSPPRKQEQALAVARA